MDGYAVCEKLKQHQKLCMIPVVFVTALKEDNDSRALDAGAEAFLSKPVDIIELTAQIRAMVKIKRSNMLQHQEKERLAAMVEDRTRELQQSFTATLNLLEDLNQENESRKISEAALMQSEKKYSSLFASMHEGFALHEIICDAAGRPVDYMFLDVNPAFERITGVKKTDLVGKTVLTVFPGTEKYWIEKYGQVALTGEPTTFENYSVELQRYYQVSAFSPEKNKFAVVANNITDRKNAELEITHAKEKAEESDRLKTAFLNNLSHEIRTPLNGILGFLAMLQETDLTLEEKKDCFKMINTSAERLMNTIDDTVEIAKIQTGQINITLRKTNISQIAVNLVAKFKYIADIKGLSISLNDTLVEDNRIINTDSEKLNIILSSLIGNAVKFTKAGSVELAVRKNNDYIEFSVKDTGIGIPVEQQQKIWKVFMQADVSHTRQFEGCGLGLSIAKAYVNMLGGEIWLDSKGDSGTVFYFNIPYSTESQNCSETATAAPAPVISATPPLTAAKILIVEDDELNFNYISVILTKAKYDVLHAWNGIEALQICHNHNDIAVILMDIKMPGMNGYEATAKIREINPAVPIIAITAHAADADRTSCLAAGMNDYASKPIRQQQLLEIVAKWQSGR
jgi:PAS domain S-box-containing protein